MSEVRSVEEVKPHPRVALSRARAQFARLMSLSEARQRELVANPLPHLTAAYLEVSKHRQRIEDARAALLGLSVRLADGDRLRPVNIAAESLDRIRKALAILEAK
jgi:hypothetical protein